MIDKNFSASVLKAIMRRSRGLSDHNLIHPEREWFIGITAAFVCLLGGIAWSIHLYVTYANSVPDFSVSPAPTSQIYRTGDVAQALEELQVRAVEHEAVRRFLEAQPRTPSFVPITLTPEESTADEPLIEETTPTEPGLLPTEQTPGPTPEQAL